MFVSYDIPRSDKMFDRSLENNYDSNFGFKNIQKISYDRKLVITEIFSNVCPHTNVVTENFSSGKLLCKKTSKS